MVHLFKEPTMPTTAEAEGNPPNPEEEPPAGNHDTRLPVQTRGGVTNHSDCHGS